MRHPVQLQLESTLIVTKSRKLKLDWNIFSLCPVCRNYRASEENVPCDSCRKKQLVEKLQNI